MILPHYTLETGRGTEIEGWLVIRFKVHSIALVIYNYKHMRLMGPNLKTKSKQTQSNFW